MSSSNYALFFSTHCFAYPAESSREEAVDDYHVVSVVSNKKKRKTLWYNSKQYGEVIRDFLRPCYCLQIVNLGCSYVPARDGRFPWPWPLLDRSQRNGSNCHHHLH